MHVIRFSVVSIDDAGTETVLAEKSNGFMLVPIDEKQPDGPSKLIAGTGKGDKSCLFTIAGHKFSGRSSAFELLDGDEWNARKRTSEI